MYRVRIFDKFHISLLEKDWHLLELGSEMTYYQSFDWNVMLASFLPKDNYFHEIIYASVYKEQSCIMIAPLLVIKHSYNFINKRGIYFLARHEWSDYVNLVYSNFCHQAFDVLLLEVKKKYKTNVFSFENLQSSTSLYKYIKRKYNVLSDVKTICVSLRLPKTINDYSLSLSKGTRQNIRTAYNRLAKDDIDYLVCKDDIFIDKGQCLLLRNQRSKIKNRRKYKFLQTLKLWIIYRWLLYKLEDYYPFIHDKNSHVLSFCHDGKLRAFFNYGIDYPHKTIVVMAAGTDMAFSRYSPGIIALYEFITKAIEEGVINTIDFTRGTEQYKYALGGQEHYVSNIKFEI